MCVRLTSGAGPFHREHCTCRASGGSSVPFKLHPKCRPCADIQLKQALGPLGGARGRRSESLHLHADAWVRQRREQGTVATGKGVDMSDKSPRKTATKKAGKSLKEKRLAKKDKEQARKEFGR